jgi:lambda family phage portal protein
MAESVTMREKAVADAAPQFIRLERMIALVSPRTALRRHFARSALAEIQLSDTYRAASTKRSYDDWVDGGKSMDAATLGTLREVRGRSRERLRHSGVARSVRLAFLNNVIGSGLTPQSQIDRAALEITEEQAEEAQDAFELAWWRFSPFVDASHKFRSHGAFQRVALGRVFTNGEAFAMPLRFEKSPDGRRRPYALAVQLIEADRVASPDHTLIKQLDDGRTVRDGVRVNQYGQAEAYYVTKYHPGDMLPGSQVEGRWVDAYNRETGNADMLHICEFESPDQTRGLPFLTAVLAEIFDHDRYMNAELMSALVAACFAVLITKNDPVSALQGQRKNADGERLRTIKPGMIDYLQPGESVNQLNPARPGGQFGTFVERILRNIGSPLGMPYETYTHDYSKTNFSSSRASLMDARKSFKVCQEWFASQFCQPIWDLCIEEAFVRGQLPSFLNASFAQNRESWTAVKWGGPGYGYVLPDKEVSASLEAINGGLSTEADECSLLGRDWQDVQDQRAREMKRRVKLGLPVYDPTAKSEAKPADDEDDDKGDGDAKSQEAA